MAQDAQIRTLLTQSRQAHARYRELAPRAVADGRGGMMARAGDTTAARAALADAAEKRAHAHALDPQHLSVVWGEEPPTHDHDALTAFYAEVLAR